MKKVILDKTERLLHHETPESIKEILKDLHAKAILSGGGMLLGLLAKSKVEETQVAIVICAILIGGKFAGIYILKLVRYEGVRKDGLKFDKIHHF